MVMTESNGDTFCELIVQVFPLQLYRYYMMERDIINAYVYTVWKKMHNGHHMEILQLVCARK